MIDWFAEHMDTLLLVLTGLWIAQSMRQVGFHFVDRLFARLKRIEALLLSIELRRRQEWSVDLEWRLDPEEARRLRLEDLDLCRLEAERGREERELAKEVEALDAEEAGDVQNRKSAR